MANKPHPLRWTLEQAGAEFNKDARALAKRIRREGLEPGEDGKFSTAQICAAVFGDLHSEELRLTREQADEKEIKNKRSRMELLDAERVYRWGEALFIVIRQRILASSLTRDEQDGLLRDLQNVKYDDIRAALVRDPDAVDAASDTAAEADVPSVG